MDAVNTVAPLRTFRCKRPSAPWLTREIRHLIQLRNSARRRLRWNRNEVTLSEFGELRKRVKSEISLARSNYYLHRISTLKTPKSIWQVLREAGVVPVTKSTSDSVTIEPQALGDYFSAGYSVDRGDAPTALELPVSAMPFDDTQFYFPHVTPEIVLDCARFGSGFVSGVDDLPGFYLRMCLPSILPLLVDIFNCSLATSTFPTTWKKAIITPIPKVTKPNQPSDYRPISLLPELSKVLERIVHKAVREYLTSIQFSDPYQYGFVPGGSTQGALAKVTDDVRRAADDRLMTVLVLLDFSKAFDTVNHRILLDKLAKLKFSRSVLKWFWSYLSSRSQAVRTSSGTSTWSSVTSGVPQGSSLGPLLFNLYTADIGNRIHNCHYVRFADDLQIYIHCSLSSLNSGVRAVNDDIERIYLWAEEHCLRLNPSKSKAMVLGSAKYVNRLELSQVDPLMANAQCIPFVTTAKNLGVVISSTLNWRDQTTMVRKRVSRTLYQLRAGSNLLSFHLRKLLVTSLLFPIFDYGSILLTDIGETEELRLQQAFNACVRFIFRVKKSEHITPLLNSLKWLRLKQQRCYFLAIFMFGIIRQNSPVGFQQHVKPLPVRVGCVATRSQSSRLNVSEHHARTSIYWRSIIASGLRLWNALPTYVKSTESRDEFKTKVFHHILESQL